MNEYQWISYEYKPQKQTKQNKTYDTSSGSKDERNHHQLVTTASRGELVAIVAIGEEIP